MKPNQPSNKLDISESISEKKGMISAMTNAAAHVAAIIAHQVNHPRKVFE
jgi:hypothetical protein